MMAFLLFLIVLAISYNNGAAHPMKIVSTNSLDDYRADVMVLKMPTVLRKEMTIYLNGILDSSETMFVVVLRDNNEASEDCKFTFDFKTETIQVTPEIDGNESWPYNYEVKPEVISKFSLKLIARGNNNGNKADMIGLSFEVNDSGESPQLICNINDFKTINSIEIQKGVEHIDSLLFEFKENH